MTKSQMRMQQGELVVKQMRDHGIAPSKTGRDGGILPGFEANGIIRKPEVRDPTFHKLRYIEKRVVSL